MPKSLAEILQDGDCATHKLLNPQFVDLSEMPDEILAQDPLIELLTKALKYRRTISFAEMLRKITGSIKICSIQLIGIGCTVVHELHSTDNNKITSRIISETSF